MTLLTVTVENGSFTKPTDQPEPNLTDINGTSATWIFNAGKSKDEVQTFIRNIAFTPRKGSNMNVSITIDGNEITGFDNIPTGSYLKRWRKNGHYYLYYKEKLTWIGAYNKAKTLNLAGRKGYLFTATNDEEIEQIRAVLDSTAINIGGTRATDLSSSRFNDHTQINTFKEGKTFYWACGPEKTTDISMDLFDKDRGQPTGYPNEWFVEVHATGGYKLHDVVNDDLQYFIVEFGGYEEANLPDPGGRDTSKTVTDVKTPETPMDVEATIGNERYAPISEALEAAKDGDTITIVKDQVTAANGATLKQGVTLEDRKGQTFKATTDSVIDVNTNGKMTLKDGQVEASASASLSVAQGGQIYDVTVPDSKTTVVAGENGSDSYVRPENDGTVKIGDISYTYTHKDGNMQTQIYIPDGMCNNEQVSKATVDAGKIGTVKIVDNQVDNQIVEVTDAASATEPVTVERKNDTVEATVPANAKVDAFGHKGITSTSGTLKVKPGKDGERTTVTVSGTNTFTADGHPYIGLKEGDVIPLGKYSVTLSIGNNITSNNQTTEYYYNDPYEVTLQPKQNYDLAKKDVEVKMGGNDVSDNATTQDGDNVKVSLTVKGDIAINADSKRQKTVITFDIEGEGTYTVTNAANENVEVNGNEVTVDRNEPITVKFTPKAKTRSADKSFAILTKLSLDGTSVFDQATLDWNTKGYTYNFTPDEAKQTIKASYTYSHLLSVKVTAGKVTGLDKYVASPNNTKPESVKTVVVPDNESVDLNFEADDTTKTNHAKLTVNGTKDKKFNGRTYTVKVDEPKEVVVAYTTQPKVTVSVENGIFDQDASDNLWTQVTGEYQTTVENDDDTKLVFEANKGYGVDLFMIGGQPVKITKNADGKYEYTLKNVKAETTVKLVFAKEYKVTFKDQNDVEVGNDSVVENHTISKQEFENAKAKLKADKGYTFFGWKDENGKIYTEEIAVTGDVVLKAYFKKGVDKGESKDNQTGLNAIIGANGFTIHVDNVKNLTADNAKDRAEAEAISSKGTMVAKENITVKGLADLQKATKAGTYELTFEAEDAKVTVKVNVQDMTPAVTGKTAYTVTIKGEPNTEYTVKNPDGSEVLDKNGQPVKGTTDANGKVTFVGLEKGKDYTITSEESGSVKTGTSAVDAADIANSFRESETDVAEVTGSGKDEKASNSKVDVVVGEDGSYKVILKDTINGTVTVPDNWGNVNVDLNGNDIKGPNATDKSPAGAGLVIKKDETGTAGGKNPGTILGITDSTGKGEIKGGDGSTKYPDGASGIETGTGKDKPENAGIIIGTGATVSGGNGATGSDGNGGTGGNGIGGSVDTKVDGGSVSGGNGGAGADTDKGNGGNGGQGGAGIKTDNKPVEVDKGTVSGGAGGNGGSSTDPSGGNGGNAGNGGTGIDSGKGDITIGKDGNTTGGSGGNGGNASSAGGNGGNGGQGGNAANGSLDKDHAQGSVTGGAGGNGGNADKGTAGAGGAGGSTGIAGNTTKGESGSAGVGKKDDGNGNGTGTVKKAVRTGDDVAPIWLLVALLAVSAGAVTTVGIRRRKRK